MASPISDFFGGVLKSLGLPDTPANRTFLLGWSQIENTRAANNPLATTLHTKNSVPLPGNPAGVQQYPTAAEGITATAATLSHYPNILAALRTGQPQSNGLNSGLIRDFSAWVHGPNAPVTSSYAQAVFRAAQGNPKGADATGIGSVDLGSIKKGASGITAGTIVGTAAGPLGGLAGGLGVGGVIDAGKGAVDATLAVPRFLAKITDPNNILRGLELVGGALLAFAGIYQLLRQVGLASAPAPPAVAAVTRSVPATFAE